MLLAPVLITTVPLFFSLGEGDAIPRPAETSKYCGPVAAWLFLDYVGIELDFEEIVERCQVTSNGMTLQRLVDVLNDAGSNVKAVRIPPERLSQAVPPFIVRVPSPDGSGHVLFVPFMSQEDIVLVDGPAGCLVVDIESFLAGVWDGNAIILDKGIQDCSSHWEAALPLVATLLLVLFIVLVKILKFPSRPAIVTVFFLAICGAAFSAVSVTRDIGYVYTGDRIEEKFSIENTTSQLVMLKITKRSCGCIGAQLHDKILEPGRSTELAIVSTGKTPSPLHAKFRDSVVVEASGGMNCSYNYTLVYTARLHFGLPQERLALGAIRSGVEITRDLPIRLELETELESLSLSTTASWLSPKFVVGKKEYVTFAPDNLVVELAVKPPFFEPFAMRESPGC